MSTQLLPAVPPAIQSDVTYPIETAKAYWFPSKSSWVEARRRGLDSLIFYVGKRGFIRGEDLQAELQRQGKRRMARTATSS